MATPGTRIAVAIRLRPLLESEARLGQTSDLIRTDLQRQTISVSGGQVTRDFHFDLVLDKQSSQGDVYERCGVDYLVGRFVEGFNVTVLAYGQTGAGKTYTMDGENSEEGSGIGLIPRVLQSLFHRVSDRSLTLSYLQLYKERLSDLLYPSSPPLKLRWNHTDQFYVDNLSQHSVNSYSSAMRLYLQGGKGKVTSSHFLNHTSSRSHCVLTLTCEGIDKEDGSAVISRFHLVDLAGSERVSLTGNTGEALKDSIDINKSLFTLRQVVSQLTSRDSQGYVPYRDSKLTSLLKQSIGGNSYCLMLACVNPCDKCVEESLSTLVYAAKTASISNSPIRNLHPKTLLAKQLKAEIIELKAELARAKTQITVLSSLNQQTEEAGSSLIPTSTGATQTLTPPLPNGMTPATLTTKLQESLRVIRELMTSNRQLREQLKVQTENRGRLENEAIQV